MKTPKKTFFTHHPFLELQKIIVSNNLILFVLIVLIIVINAAGFFSVKWLQAEWKQQYTVYQTKQTLYVDLYRESGYGGFIHAFKNAVLRKKPTYLKSLSKRYHNVEATVSALKALATSIEEKTKLQEVQNTFDSYWQKYDLLKKGVQENWSAEKLDKQVFVNDEAALKALNQLITINQEKFDRSVEKNNQLIQQMGLYEGVSLGVILFFSLMLYFAMRKKAGLVGKVLRMQKEAVANKELYEATLDSMVDACIITDATGKIENFNQIALERFGYTPDELMGQPIEILIPEGEHKKNHAHYMDSSSMHKKVLFKGRELKAITKNGELLSSEITVTPLKQSEDLKFVGIIHDISNRMKLMEQLGSLLNQLRDEATKDYLTGLLNRKAFFEQADQILLSAKESEKPIAVLMIDIDYFKKVNDSFGHDVGDRVLMAVAKAFKKDCREEDLVCRYGGEEFVILLDNKDEEPALEFASRLKKIIQEISISEQGEQIRFSISIGLTVGNALSTNSIEPFISRADQALYQAKANGRNRVEVNHSEE
ncbi:sensor domain-containing diguanylate cyclase [Hydrogenovibrio sp. 3SP14C1]|uniref:sensor domain-containing diguanylate cyclase n=1 Tax=Hydrogenovibrio sp. 3SP14C1 TaxID=3038774 RepID=UPI0024160CB3|nr:sensor domain-containing diguanylate cyclase [Hydrogenovibrio sp. 3SP14C1]MDG4812050.1 sensor domain-containing diguanylate cyclase [Hydrogenovibrio sp. 3SP14C1]